MSNHNLIDLVETFDNIVGSSQFTVTAKLFQTILQEVRAKKYSRQQPQAARSSSPILSPAKLSLQTHPKQIPIAAIEEQPPTPPPPYRPHASRTRTRTTFFKQ